MPSKLHAHAPTADLTPAGPHPDRTIPHRNSTAVRDRLVQDHLGLVRNIAASMLRSAPQIMSFDDLVAWGNKGLLAAATNFDPNRRRADFAEPITFAQYAERRIRGAIIDGERLEGPFGDCRPRKRLPPLKRIAIVDESHLEAILSDPLGDPSYQEAAGPDAGELADYRRLVHQLRAAVDQLPPQLRAFTQTHYYEDVPLHAVGRQLGVSKYAVHRLRNAAIREISMHLVTRQRHVPAVGDLQ